MAKNRLAKYQTHSNGPTDDTSAMDGLFEKVEPLVQRASDTIGDIVRRQPLATFAAGIALGVIPGCLIKRR